MEYIFKTAATMKPHNRKKWWIDRDIIDDIRITADSVQKALEQWRKIVCDRFGVDVSENAIKCKQPMYIDDENGDPRQVGYVITGKTDFDKGDYSGWSTQYIDLWVTVISVVPTVF